MSHFLLALAWLVLYAGLLGIGLAAIILAVVS